MSNEALRFGRLRLCYLCSVNCCWVAGLAWKSVAFYFMKCMSLEPPLNLPVDRTQVLKFDVAIGFRPSLTVRVLAGGLTLGRGQRAGTYSLLCLLWPVCGWAWLSTLGFLPSSSLEIQSLSTQHGMSKMGFISIRFLVERRLLGKSCDQDQPRQVPGVSSPDRGISRGWLGIRGGHSGQPVAGLFASYGGLTMSLCLLGHQKTWS